MRLFTKLSDWPFAVKMGFAPTLCVVALIVVGSFADFEAQQQTGLVDSVVGQNLQIAIRLSADATALERVRGGLYRLLVLRAARAPAPELERNVTDIKAGVDHICDDLVTLRSRANTTALARSIAASRTSLQHYADTLRAAGFLLRGDFASSIGLVRPFDDDARRMLAGFDALTGQLVAGARQHAADSQATAIRLRHVFLGTELGVLLLVTLCAGAITHRTVGSMRRIARATLMVANGDETLRIDNLARQDELGAIVDSLRSFQCSNARINFLAHHDALTALPNRVLFHDRMELGLEQCSPVRPCAIHCVDLDHFKAVNDALGHPVGDLLLKEVALRLAGCAQEGDTVARLGGDEFAIIQLGIGGGNDAARLAGCIIEAIGNPFVINGHQIIVGASVGVALAPAPDDPAPASVDTLLRRADMALYRAKSEGRSTWRFFAADMDAALQQRRVLELDMRGAIANAEFELLYQPLVNVVSREVSGLEALIRWHHPQRGTIPPAEFIPLAEETGLIVQIGAWVLRQACADAATWHSNLKVAVNLSPLQFKDSQLVQTVQQALASAGLPPWRLDLEITEGVLLQDNEPTIATLHRLRNLGIRISLDDFGTGYSSLSYLRSFPFDKIKIDKSFIRDLADQGGSVAIVRAVTGLSKSLGIHTTAEGVENEAQLAQLIAEGCTEVQGYLFSPPRPACDVPRVVEEISRRPPPGLLPTLVPIIEDAM